mmetsp:Transcript_4384/g.8357  ORF Transcript_4384/g.8357 Transcript_4384/m.8357 type:complete len:125 (+) Transcript_4384:57-431(+)
MNNKSTSKTKLEPPKGSGGGDRYVYRDWSNATPCQTDLDAIEREKDLHPDARKLPVKLNAILNNLDSAASNQGWMVTRTIMRCFFVGCPICTFERSVSSRMKRRPLWDQSTKARISTQCQNCPK